MSETPIHHTDHKDATDGGRTGATPEAPFPVVVSKAKPPAFETPELASEAMAKTAADDGDDLTIILTCGDAGGVAVHRRPVLDEDGDETGEWTVEEEPCDHPSSFGVPGSRYGITPGRCFKHTAAALQTKARRKAEFLEAYCLNPELGVRGAAKAIGLASPATVYWWRRHDRDFDANMSALVEIADAVAADRVEEDVLKAIREWKPGASELAKWWLINRRGHRWKNPNKPAASDNPFAGGGVNISGGQHVWKIGDQKVEF